MLICQYLLIFLFLILFIYGKKISFKVDNCDGTMKSCSTSIKVAFERILH